jgi:hypothetical protein
MRKGLLGTFQVGMLGGMREALEIAERLTGAPRADVDALFYATAFQAGVDRFILPVLTEYDPPASDFVRSRIAYLSTDQSRKHGVAIREAFSRFLASDYYRDEAYSPVWTLEAFLGDLMDAMESGSALLAISGAPDQSELERLLPPELLLPIGHLLDSFEMVETPEIVPRSSLDREQLERFQQVLSSDVFSGYVSAQSALDEATRSLPVALDTAIKAGREVVKNNPTLLTLRRGSAGVLSVTPKLIDAAFGKLPGALAEAAAKLGISYLEDRKRVTVYDFREVIQRIFLSNLVRMFKSSGGSLASTKTDDSYAPRE